jgi:prefoldin subunit 5
MNPTILLLRQRIEALNKELLEVSTALKVISEMCTHTNPDGRTALVYHGNDSHYDYDKCQRNGQNIE